MLGLQSNIDTVEATLTSTRSTVAHHKIPPEALQAIESLKRNPACLLQNVKLLYTSLNIGNTFPELEGLSLDFVCTLLLAWDLKINIHKRAVANFLEFDKLDRAVGGKQNPLGEYNDGYIMKRSSRPINVQVPSFINRPGKPFQNANLR